MTKTINKGSKGKKKYIDLVYIKFDGESEQTRGGDSGAVWVEVDSKRPVGLHRGLQGWRFADGSNDYVAYATSIAQLIRWHPFKFSPSKTSALRPQLCDFQSSLVQLKSGLVTFCRQPDDGSLWIKKFDTSGTKTSETKTDLASKNGFAAAKLGKNIFAIWRGKGKKIRLASMQKSDAKLGQILVFPFKTSQQPALVNFQNQLIMAYTDDKRQRVNIAHSSNGKNWYPFEVSNAKTQHGPALLPLKNKVVLCWVDNANNQLMTADLYQSGRSFNIYNRNTLWKHQSTSSPLMAGGPGKSFLAYCTKKGHLVVLEKSNKTQWKPYSTDSTVCNSPPSLLVVNDEPLAIRPGASV